MKFNLNDLRDALNTKIERIEALAAEEMEKGSLSDEQLAEFAQLSEEVKAAKAQLARQESAQALSAQKAKPPTVTGGHAIHTQQELKEYPGSKFVRLAMSVAAGRGNLTEAAQFAENEIGDSDVAMAVTTAADSGGALVPENWADDVIPLLQPRNVVRRLGAVEVDLPNGNLTMPRQTGGATSSYRGEDEEAKVSSPDFGELKMQAKEQISMVPISNRLIGHAGYRTEQLVLNDMINATAGAQDRAFLRGDGSNNSPVGMRKTALDAGRIISFSGDKDAKNVDEYLGALLLALEESNSLMIAPGWVLSPRTARYLMDLKNASGKFQYPEMKEGLLKGVRFEKTTNIPADLGAGGNESEILLADFNDVLIGDTNTWAVDFSKDSAYRDANGVLQLAFQKNQSLLRLVNENDIGFRHLEGLVLGDKVTFNSMHYLNN